jgi:hypothetical protein
MSSSKQSSNAKYSDDVDIDKAFKNKYLSTKRGIIKLQFESHQIPNLPPANYKILTTSRTLKGGSSSPSDTLFRTHTYEFRIIRSSEGHTLSSAATPIAAVHLRLLHKSTKGNKPTYSEFNIQGVPVILFTQTIHPHDDPVVIMTWPEGVKTSFRGKFKVELSLYTFTNRDTLARMDIIARYTSSEFNVVSKPGVWLNNQRKNSTDDMEDETTTAQPTPSKPKPTVGIPQPDNSFAGAVPMMNPFMPMMNPFMPMMHPPPAMLMQQQQMMAQQIQFHQQQQQQKQQQVKQEQKTTNTATSSSTTVKKKGTITVVKKDKLEPKPAIQQQQQPVQPIVQDNLLEEDDGLIPEQLNLNLTSQEQILLNVEDQTDMFVPFLSFNDPNTPLQMLSPNGGVMINESLGEVTGNNKFLSLSFGDLSDGIRGRAMSSQDWDQFIDEEPNTSDKFFEKNFLGGK